MKPPSRIRSMQGLAAAVIIGCALAGCSSRPQTTSPASSNTSASSITETGSTNENPQIAGIGDAAKGNSINVYAFSSDTMIQIYGSVVTTSSLADLASLAVAHLA